MQSTFGSMISVRGGTPKNSATAEGDADKATATATGHEAAGATGHEEAAAPVNVAAAAAAFDESTAQGVRSLGQGLQHGVA